MTSIRALTSPETYGNLARRARQALPSRRSSTETPAPPRRRQFTTGDALRGLFALPFVAAPAGAQDVDKPKPPTPEEIDRRPKPVLDEPVEPKPKLPAEVDDDKEPKPAGPPPKPKDSDEVKDPEKPEGKFGIPGYKPEYDYEKAKKAANDFVAEWNNVIDWDKRLDGLLGINPRASDKELRGLIPAKRDKDDPFELTRESIKEMIEDFIKARKAAKEAGLPADPTKGGIYKTLGEIRRLELVVERRETVLEKDLEPILKEHEDQDKARRYRRLFRAETDVARALIAALKVKAGIKASKGDIELAKRVFVRLRDDEETSLEALKSHPERPYGFTPDQTADVKKVFGDKVDFMKIGEPFLLEPLAHSEQ